MTVEELILLLDENKELPLCKVKIKGTVYLYRNAKPYEILKDLEKWTSTKLIKKN